MEALHGAAPERGRRPQLWSLAADPYIRDGMQNMLPASISCLTWRNVLHVAWGRVFSWECLLTPDTGPVLWVL